MEWPEGRLVGFVDDFQPQTFRIVVPIDQVLPKVNTTARASINIGDATRELSGEVVGIEQVYGTFRGLYFRVKDSATVDGRTIQRRANSRFKIGPMVPLYCFVTVPGRRGVVPFRAIDVSNGGISILGPASHAATLFPGTNLYCQFQVPSAGSRRASIVVRHVGDASGSSFDNRTLCRIAAEFNDLSRGARDLISRCLVSPMTNNAVSDLSRENLLHRDWPRIIDFRVVRSSDRDFDIVASLSGERLCSIRFNVPNLRLDIRTVESAAIPNALKELARQVGNQSAWLGIDGNKLRAALEEWSRTSNAPVVVSSIAANGSQTHAEAGTPRQANRVHVEWAEYAEAYDVMCEANPAYQANLSLFRAWVARLKLPPNAQICDVGAGTGNYVVELARTFPHAVIYHIDSDPVMNRTASRKYRTHGLTNVSFDTHSAAEAAILDASLDLVICVNALYTFPNPEQTIAKFHRWLKPGGYIFLIDLGRPMNVGDWARFILASSVRNSGILNTLIAFAKGRKAIGQNRRIRHEQDCGRYWVHSTQRFGSVLSKAGFSIAHLGTCYRDVCDLAICQRPESRR